MLFQRDRVVRSHLAERFVVTLTSGETFEGLLVDADSSTVQLVQAVALSAAGRTDVDGQLFLPRRQVAYMQRPGTA